MRNIFNKRRARVKKVKQTTVVLQPEDWNRGFMQDVSIASVSAVGTWAILQPGFSDDDFRMYNLYELHICAVNSGTITIKANGLISLPIEVRIIYT